MAQSNEQGDDEIDRSNLELIFSDYMNGEWNGNMFQDILDWHIRDRKQHELDALHGIIAENTDTINGTIDADGVFESVTGKIESLKGGI